MYNTMFLRTDCIAFLRLLVCGVNKHPPTVDSDIKSQKTYAVGRLNQDFYNKIRINFMFTINTNHYVYMKNQSYIFISSFQYIMRISNNTQNVLSEMNVI